ncbi:MAG: MATE family efflux transporter, partial [Clostridiales bacterium]|nr:MATE family efflux transporter [Clostridiales bacterium]
MQTQERSKILGSMDMGKLVPKVASPVMISMLVQALYNVVDGIFVARYSADALTAVSLAYPVQMLMIAVST